MKCTLISVCDRKTANKLQCRKACMRDFDLQYTCKKMELIRIMIFNTFMY